MTITLLILGWLACGVAACGWAFAYLQREPGSTNRHHWFLKDRFFCGVLFWFGFIGLILSWFFTFGAQYGWLWPWSAKAKREAGL